MIVYCNSNVNLGPYSIQAKLRFVKIQKHFIRFISLSTYNDHTEPWFKHFEILKINKLFDMNCLKFIYNFNRRKLPNYFLDFRYEQLSSIHNHGARFANLIDAEPTRTVMAEHCIRHHIVTLLNCTPRCILDKITTHSLQGFTFCIKRYYLNQMSYECSLRQCYVSHFHRHMGCRIHHLFLSMLFFFHIPSFLKCTKDGISSYSTSRTRRWLFS